MESKVKREGKKQIRVVAAVSEDQYRWEHLLLCPLFPAARGNRCTAFPSTGQAARSTSEHLQKAAWQSHPARERGKGVRGFHSSTFVSIHMGLSNTHYWVVLAWHIKPDFPLFMHGRGFSVSWSGNDVFSAHYCLKGQWVSFSCNTTVYQCNIFHLNP